MTTAVKAKPTPWLPKLYKNATLFHRAAIYMALHPGKYFSPRQLTNLLSCGWPATEVYLQRLVSVGLAVSSAGYSKTDQGRYSTGMDDMAPSMPTPKHLKDLPSARPIPLYAASPKLVELVASGAFLQMITTPRRVVTMAVNERIIRLLQKLHSAGKPLSIPELKKAIDASEALPALFYRMAQLAEADWVELSHALLPPYAQGGYSFYYGALWAAQLSAGGWLKLQRAEADGTKWPVPKTLKKPAKISWESYIHMLDAQSGR